MKLLDQVRVKIKFLHYSDETAKIYVYWIKQYILFHHKRHPADMGKNEIEQFLSHFKLKGSVPFKNRYDKF
ncbi:phage integrase N-terminal SAM-like domain-containing protein [Zobellella taiwanensis]